MKSFYTNTELTIIADRANSYKELERIALTLKYLWALGEKIDLQFFNKKAHIRLKYLMKL